ncbi:hypothetical protein GCM10027343_32290 [Noviherbaspirillum agri]
MRELDGFHQRFFPFEMPSRVFNQFNQHGTDDGVLRFFPGHFLLKALGNTEKILVIGIDVLMPDRKCLRPGEKMQIELLRHR